MPFHGVCNDYMQNSARMIARNILENAEDNGRKCIALAEKEEVFKNLSEARPEIKAYFGKSRPACSLLGGLFPGPLVLSHEKLSIRRGEAGQILILASL